MATVEKDFPVGGFVPTFSWRLIGSAAPVWPGFDVDVLTRIPDAEREDAVWHRERAKAILKAHPEVKDLFGRDPTTAFWCLLVAGTQVALAVACGFLPWWGMVLLAWLVGSSINIMLFQLGHDFAATDLKVLRDISTLLYGKDPPARRGERNGWPVLEATASGVRAWVIGE